MRRWGVVLGAIIHFLAIAILLWVMLHPRREADPNIIPPDAKIVEERRGH